jgi:hypothetical protein
MAEFRQPSFHLGQFFRKQPNKIQRDGGDRGQKLDKSLFGNNRDQRILNGNGRERSFLLGEEKFAEDLIGLEDVQDGFPSLVRQGSQLHQALLQDVKRIGRLTFAKYPYPPGKPLLGAEAGDLSGIPLCDPLK